MPKLVLDEALLTLSLAHLTVQCCRVPILQQIGLHLRDQVLIVRLTGQVVEFVRVGNQVVKRDRVAPAVIELVASAAQHGIGTVIAMRQVFAEGFVLPIRDAAGQQRQQTVAIERQVAGIAGDIADGRGHIDQGDHLSEAVTAVNLPGPDHLKRYAC